MQMRTMYGQLSFQGIKIIKWSRIELLRRQIDRRLVHGGPYITKIIMFLALILMIRDHAQLITIIICMHVLLMDLLPSQYMWKEGILRNQGVKM